VFARVPSMRGRASRLCSRPLYGDARGVCFARGTAWVAAKHAPSPRSHRRPPGPSRVNESRHRFFQEHVRVTRCRIVQSHPRSHSNSAPPTAMPVPIVEVTSRGTRPTEYAPDGPARDSDHRGLEPLADFGHARHRARFAQFDGGYGSSQHSVETVQSGVRCTSAVGTSVSVTRR